MSNEIDVIVKRWKEIPVIGAQVFMTNFPYLVSPWDHWNKVVDILTDRDEKENKIEDIDEKDSINEETYDTVNKETISVITDRAQQGEEITEENDGYRTDNSEMKEFTNDSKSVDWEQSDNEL
jgi:hypothetical protein